MNDEDVVEIPNQTHRSVASATETDDEAQARIAAASRRSQFLLNNRAAITNATQVLDETNS